MREEDLLLFSRKSTLSPSTGLVQGQRLSGGPLNVSEVSAGPAFPPFYTSRLWAVSTCKGQLATLDCKGRLAPRSALRHVYTVCCPGPPAEEPGEDRVQTGAGLGAVVHGTNCSYSMVCTQNWPTNDSCEALVNIRQHVMFHSENLSARKRAAGDNQKVGSNLVEPQTAKETRSSLPYPDTLMPTFTHRDAIVTDRDPGDTPPAHHPLVATRCSIPHGYSACNPLPVVTRCSFPTPTLPTRGGTAIASALRVAVPAPTKLDALPHCPRGSS